MQLEQTVRVHLVKIAIDYVFLFLKYKMRNFALNLNSLWKIECAHCNEVGTVVITIETQKQSTLLK